MAQPLFIDLTDEDAFAAEQAYDDEDLRIIELIDLTRDIHGGEDDPLPVAAQSSRRGTRMRPLPLSSTHRSVQTSGGLRVHAFVELKVAIIIEECQISFMEVEEIWLDDASREVILRGIPYARNKDVGGRLELKTNEVCQILQVSDDDNSPVKEQSLINMWPCQVLRARKCNKTNTKYPACRYGNDPFWSRETREQRALLAPLTCRWKMQLHYLNAGYRKVGKPYGTALVHLAERDVADPQYRTLDKQRRKDWIGRHVDSRSPAPLRFGDAFCGAGGASSGALMAGLEPCVAIDNWAEACATYRRQFPGAQVFEEDIFEFITGDRGAWCIDVLHISPPCQYWSPARVNPGRNDEANLAATYASEELLTKIRPRVFTMEQTYGLLQRRYAQYFAKLIQSITAKGYSVQWRNRVELVRYGLPQNRKRLVIIGCAPGEQLPAWPSPTHGSGPGQRPLVTEAQAIGHLPFLHPLHKMNGARQVDGPVRDPNTPLGRTIVCSGVQGVVHYNGQRTYTLRELATLQGFPREYQFVGTSSKIRKQIGNAFPSVVAQVFFRAIRESLEARDRGVQPEQPDPGYSRLNRYLDNDEALEAAIKVSQAYARESRYIVLEDSDDDDEALQAAVEESQAHARQSRHIVLDSSDDEPELRRSMGRLSVKPLASTSTSHRGTLLDSPTEVAGPPASSNVATRAFSHGHLSRRRSSSTESSHTLGRSISPSPSARPVKRQRNALDIENRDIADKGKGKQKCVEIIDVDATDEPTIARNPSTADRLAASGGCGCRDTAGMRNQEAPQPPRSLFWTTTDARYQN